MDGHPISEAWVDEPDARFIPSWDDVDGESGMHPPDAKLDPVAQAESVRQLVDLGYVDPPSDDVRVLVDECTRGLRYNLTQAQIDASSHVEAAVSLESLWDEWPDEHRFATRLMACYESLGWSSERSETLELFEKRSRTIWSNERCGRRSFHRCGVRLRMHSEDWPNTIRFRLHIPSRGLKRLLGTSPCACGAGGDDRLGLL